VECSLSLPLCPAFPPLLTLRYFLQKLFVLLLLLQEVSLKTAEEDGKTCSIFSSSPPTPGTRHKMKTADSRPKTTLKMQSKQQIPGLRKAAQMLKE
jgi:hypothetical protein